MTFSADERALRAAQRLREAFGTESDKGGPQGTVRNAFPAWRVFIYGFEVTEDVVSITVQNHVGKQPNSCSITLLNERDKYVLTTDDILSLTGLDPTRFQIATRDLGYISVEDANQVTQQLIPVIQPGGPTRTGQLTPNVLTDDFRIGNPLSVKNQIFFLKQQHAKIKCDVINADGTFANKQVERTRYPYADGVPIFHPNDPVRVFVRDVFDPGDGTQRPMWFYGFSGLITDMTDDVSKDNQKSLTVAAEDPTKILRYARITANPGILDPNVIIPGLDEASRGAYTSATANKTLEEIMDFLVFGSHQDLPPGASPRFAAAFTAGASETALRELAISSGLFKVDDAAEQARVDQARQSPNPSMAAVIASLSQATRTRLDEYIKHQRELAEARTQTESTTIEVDHINRFGDRVIRRLGIGGIGAFKPAQDRRQVLTDLSTFQATAADPLEILNPGVVAALLVRPPPSVSDILNESPIIRGPAIYSLGDDDGAPPGTEVVTLEQWNEIISNKVKATDIIILLNKDVDPAVYRRLVGSRSKLATIDDVVTLIGEDPVNFPVDGGRLLMLMPFGAGVIGREIVAQDLLQSWATRTAEFQNRLSLIYEALDRIEFVFYCSPKGDLIVEFPLYDFDFDDFGGAWQPVYIVEKEDLFSCSSSFSDAAVRTIVTVDVAGTNYQSIARQITQARAPGVVKIPSMFPQYGVRLEQANMKGVIQTEAAANLYGNIILNRLNADAHSVNLPIVPRWDVGLNRPILWKLRNHIGTTMSVTHNMQWNGSFRTSLGLSHLRGWTGDLEVPENGALPRMIYKPIGGAASRPLNYAVLFARSATPASSTRDINETEAAANQATNNRLLALPSST